MDTASERASRASRAAHRKRIDRQIAWVRLAERIGDAFTLPSGRVVRILGTGAVLHRSLIGLQPSGRMKFYEIDGERLSPGALSRDDRRALHAELTRRKREAGE